MKKLIVLLLPFLALLFSGKAYAGSTAVTATENTVGSTTPGQTLTYTNVIGATGLDATGVQFSDGISDSNLTLVGGSLSATPVAIDDTYLQTVVANMSVNTATSGYSVVANDFSGISGGVAVPLSSLTIAAFDATSAHGGAVTMTTSGSNVGQFTYTPAPGYTGSDTFTYTISNGVGGATADRTATVHLTVSGPVIWFVDTATGSDANNGTLGHPFRTVAHVSTVDAANHKIFVYTGTYAETAGLTLKSGEALVGQGAVGASFDAVLGISPTPGSDSPARPTVNGTRPSMNRTAGTVLTLASGNSVLGLNFNNSSGSGITGSAVGTLTLADFDVTATGGSALSLTTSGTVTATGTNNNLNSNNGNALNVANVSIGVAGLTFKSITSTTASANSGIVLNNSGSSGGLTVTGTGSTAGSGGTISNKTVDDISLTSTAHVSLSNMIINIANNTHSGILGTGVNGFSLIGSSVTGNGVASGNNSGSCIMLTDTSGAVTFTNDAVTGASNQGVWLENSPSSAAVITTLTVTGGSYNNSKGDGFLSELHGSSAVNTALFSGVTFSGNASMALNLVQNDNGSYGNGVGTPGDPLHQAGTATVTGCTLSNSGGLGASFAGGGGNGTGSSYFRIVTNTITGSHSHALNFVSGATATGGTYQALVSDNIIGDAVVADSGSKLGEGIVVTVQAQSGAVTIANNTIRGLANGAGEFGNRGIDVQALGPVGSGLGQKTLDLKITGNDVNAQYTGSSPPPLYAIYVGADGQGTGSSGSTVHAEIHGNTVPATHACDTQCNADTGMIVFETVSGATGTTLGTLFNFSGVSVGSGNTVSKEIANNNTGTAGKTCSYLNGGSLTLTGTAPGAVLLLFSPGGIEIAIPAAEQTGLGLRNLTLFRPDSFAVRANQIPTAEPKPSFADENQEAAPALQNGAKASKAKGIAGADVHSQEQLDLIVSAARTRWEATGLTAEQTATLRSLSFEAAALSNLHLGEAQAHRIRVSVNAGGNGWFIGASAQSDAKFGNRRAATRLDTDPAGEPAGRIDLLTAIMHEMGHALGLPDTYRPQDRNSLMYGFLTQGERRLPASGQALGAVPGSLVGTRFVGGPVTVNIGTLPAGKTVTITFQATVASPFPTASPPCPASPTVSLQGTVTGTQGSSFTIHPTAAVTTIEVPPTITGATISRQQGSPSSNSQIATVDDCNQTENTLTVTVNSGSSATVNGVTVSGISVDASGHVTANVVAACSASNATFTLTVADANAQTATATLTVNVTSNTVPTLGTYPSTTMNVSANGTVTPSAAPTDNGTVSSVTASAPSFTGTLTGNATTGAITIQNAGPSGSYIVTVTSTDNCGTTTTTTFQLVVNAIPVANPDSLVRQKNAAAKIAVSQVLANDTDADGDTLTVTGVSSPSPNGATVTLEGLWIIYQPPTGFNSSDTFTYNISDGRGGTATGAVNVTVAADSDEQTKNIVSITASGADMIVRVAGIAGRVYRFETTSSLTSPITWTPHPAGPQTAGADGIVQLTDTAPPSPRFYRAVEN